jgi:tRNA modification GTPase
MNFNHRPYQPGETIAAIATPPGEGGISVIRISGHEAILIANKIFSKSILDLPSHTVHYGKIIDRNQGNQVIDTVLLLLMRDRRSFTGEETVEIHCHGGSLITRRVLELILRSGARAAGPGEFSLKAFMNGKIDLAQAEAIQEVIGAKNELALDAAANHLQGALSTKIQLFQAKLAGIAAILEAWVDFPEEGLEFASMEEIVADLENAEEEMSRLHRTFHDGKILHDGVSLALIGSPNVGKSSLMNALLGRDRAIVTPIAGTTRDLLEDHLRLGGLNLKLTDTAGIREGAEVIEQEGIRRSKRAMEEADLVLFILDGSRPISNEERELLSSIPHKKSIIVQNKIDLGTIPFDRFDELSASHLVPISAATGQGLDQLKKEIDRLIWQGGPPSKEEIYLTNARHKEALERAIEACGRIRHGLLDGMSPEFLSLDMRVCLNELGMIIGMDVSEEILNSIFSKFCIGK